MKSSLALLESVRMLIRRHCGLNCEENVLAAAVAERQERLATPAPDDYLTLLNKDASEFDNLVALLTNNETYFFREANQFDLLLEKLIPDLMASRAHGDAIRILSAGCSSGEEPYSIAMALREKFGKDTAARFNIVGADIDQQALCKAADARYGEYSFRALPEALRSRYFEPAGEKRYLLTDEIRSLVRFRYLNLMAEPPLAVLPGFDVVFFRNVSIYFDETTRRAIQKNLCKLMNEKGYLLFGNTETLANDLGVFRLKQYRGVFYFSKEKPRHKPLPINKETVAADTAEHSYRAAIDKLSAITGASGDKTLMRPVVEQAAESDRSVSAENPNLEQVRALMADQLWERALVLLQSCDVKDPALMLLEAWARMQGKDIAAAERLATEVYRRNEWSLEAAVLLGLAAKLENRNEQAIIWLKRAVYINPDCWAAHYYLAEVYRNSKEFEAAGRYYRVVLQCLDGKFHSDAGLSIPLGLPVAEIRFLCAGHLQSLEMPEAAGYL